MMFMTGAEIVIDEMKKPVYIEGHEGNIFLIRTFSGGLWKTISSGTNCPGDTRLRSRICCYRGVCNFKKCPYGLNNIHKKN